MAIFYIYITDINVHVEFADKILISAGFVSFYNKGKLKATSVFFMIYKYGVATTSAFNSHYSR